MNNQRTAVFLLLVSLVTAVLGLSSSGLVMETRAETGVTAPQPYMLKNLNPTTPSSNPKCTADMGDFMLCVVDDGLHGRELWRSDGTQEGSELVKDIYAGEEGSLESLYETASIGNTLFFAATDEAHGRELWKTDGTTEGTMLVKDINIGPEITDLLGITAVGTSIFFMDISGEYPNRVYELWISDGTEAGTEVIKELIPLPEALGSGNYLGPTSFVAMGDKLYFAFDDGEHGLELWRSDGTAAGTYIVKDISPVYDWRYAIRDLSHFDDALYFTIDDGVHGRELWKSDGTETGTVLVKDIYDGLESSFPSNLSMMNNLLYFSAFSDGEHSLWRSDGTDAGTVRITTIPDGPIWSWRVAGNNLFFINGFSTDFPFHALWVSDGTDTGTAKILEFYDSCYYESKLFPVASKNRVFVCLYFNDVRSELWTSDGTSEGTYLVKDIAPGDHSSEPHPQIQFNGKVYFAATDIGHDRELWVTDGSEEGTQKAVDFNRSEDEDSYPRHFSPLGGNGRQVIFRASNNEVGNEPYISDGTVEGTHLLKDINPGPDGSFHDSGDLPPVALSNGLFLFYVFDKVHGEEIWVSDGTEAGTTPLFQTCSDYAYEYENRRLAATTNFAFFTSGCQDGLWKTDGTPGGTSFVADMANSNESYLEASSEHLFFYSENELWTIGDSAGSTPLLISDYVDFPNWYKTPILVKDTAFFTRQAPGERRYLWKTDGTPGGTTRIKEANIGYWFPANDMLYYWEGYENGLGMWISDGTTLGTKPVRGWAPGNRPIALTADSETVLFSVWTKVDDDDIYSLWRTDGTSEGTEIVREFSTLDGGPRYLTAFAGTTFFSADDGIHGTELWTSDGSEAGTQMIADINQITGASSDPYDLSPRGTTLFFGAYDGQHGGEPWAIDLSQIPPAANFSATPRGGLPPLQVTFKNLTGGIYDSCTWDFGGGDTVSGCEDQTRIYTGSGAFPVSLTVSGPAGEDTLTREGYIRTDVKAVTADFSASPTAGRAPLAVNFTNKSEGDFDSCFWEFGDGEAGFSCVNQSHTYTDAGVYTVSLTIYGLGGSTTKTISKAITIAPTHDPVKADFSASPTSGPPPLTVNFKNLSTGDFDTCVWEFGDGHTASSCEDQTHTYPNWNNYSVYLTISGPGGSDTKYLGESITVFEPPRANFSASPTSGPPPLTVTFLNLSSGGEIDSFLWDFGDGTTSNAYFVDPSHTYTRPGKYQVSLTANGPGGEHTETKKDYISVENHQIFMPCVSGK